MIVDVDGGIIIGSDIHSLFFHVDLVDDNAPPCKSLCNNCLWPGVLFVAQVIWHLLLPIFSFDILQDGGGLCSLPVQKIMRHIWSKNEKYFFHNHLGTRGKTEKFASQCTFAFALQIFLDILFS